MSAIGASETLQGLFPIRNCTKCTSYSCSAGGILLTSLRLMDTIARGEVFECCATLFSDLSLCCRLSRGPACCFWKRPAASVKGYMPPVRQLRIWTTCSAVKTPIPRRLNASYWLGRNGSTAGTTALRTMLECACNSAITDTIKRSPIAKGHTLIKLPPATIPCRPVCQPAIRHGRGVMRTASRNWVREWHVALTGLRSSRCGFCSAG
jgi:hypothetical protein